MRRRNRPEDEAQRALVKWAGLQRLSDPPDRSRPMVGDYLLHIPNGGKRTRIEAAILQGLGVKAGVSDLFLALPRGHYAGLWIELKSDGGRLTGAQRQWLEQMAAAGYQAASLCGWENAATFIQRYLSYGRPCSWPREAM